jgi:hypothetical protein
MNLRSIPFSIIAACLTVGTVLPAAAQTDPLPSWNDTASKKAIVAFVEKVTKEGSADFVPVSERIAVFDNDGTLWPENPIPFQLAFASYEITRLLPDHPEWDDDPAIQAFKKGDLAALLADHAKGLLRIVALTHANDHGRVRPARQGLGRQRSASPLRPSLH